MIVPIRLQMSKINGEPLAQTQIREKQVMFNFQSEIELMRLRIESHEERYKRIDSEMDDIIEKNLSGQRKEMIRKLWREECAKEEKQSTESWENSNVMWTKKYETEFLIFFADQNPFISDEKFLPLPQKNPNNIRNKPASQQQEQ